MNVFVLGTGRCGTTTFIEACRHLTNFTADHESLVRKYGAARFDYPPRHIEADNRLTWFLPQLEEAMVGREVYFVHLLRDREATARSFSKRMGNGKASIITAFAHAMVINPRDWTTEEELELCRFYVDTVTAQISRFLRDQPHRVMHLETLRDEFPAFLDQIGAEGDRDAALAELENSHNAS